MGALRSCLTRLRSPFVEGNTLLAAPLAMHSRLLPNRDVRSDTDGARALGWASIGIGLSELAAPANVENLLGLEDRPERRGILRVLGVRELMHGIGILTEQKPTPQLAAGVWSRVAGDVLDMALLGIAATKTKRPGKFAVVASMVGAIGVLDTVFALRLLRDARRYA